MERQPVQTDWIPGRGFDYNFQPAARAWRVRWRSPGTLPRVRARARRRTRSPSVRQSAPPAAARSERGGEGRSLLHRRVRRTEPRQVEHHDAAGAGRGHHRGSRRLDPQRRDIARAVHARLAASVAFWPGAPGRHLRQQPVRRSWKRGAGMPFTSTCEPASRTGSGGRLRRGSSRSSAALPRWPRGLPARTHRTRPPGCARRRLAGAGADWPGTRRRVRIHFARKPEQRLEQHGPQRRQTGNSREVAEGAVEDPPAAVITGPREGEIAVGAMDAVRARLIERCPASGAPAPGRARNSRNW